MAEDRPPPPPRPEDPPPPPSSPPSPLAPPALPLGSGRVKNLNKWPHSQLPQSRKPKQCKILARSLAPTALLGAGPRPYRQLHARHARSEEGSRTSQQRSAPPRIPKLGGRRKSDEAAERDRRGRARARIDRAMWSGSSPTFGDRRWECMPKKERIPGWLKASCLFLVRTADGKTSAREAEPSRSVSADPQRAYPLGRLRGRARCRAGGRWPPR